VHDARPPASEVAAVEKAWGVWTTALVTWSLLAVALARSGIFRGWACALAALLAVVAAWAFLRSFEQAGQQISGLARPTSADSAPTIGWAQRARSWASQREALYVTLLLAVGLVLFGWPAESRTGGLSYHFEPLDGLIEAQKRLFYVPSDLQFSTVEIQSYKGVLYGAYYVMDPQNNTIVASRPPLVFAWMGWLAIMFGPSAMPWVVPVFGALSLVVVYFLGKRVFAPGVGALGALWVAVSFPQLYFARAPYAEAVGQFFILTALYSWVAHLQTRRLWYCGLGIAAWAAAFAARVDSILAVPILGLFLLMLALRKDRQALVTGALGLAATAVFTLWTVNWPYTGATAELLLSGYLRFLGQGDTPVIAAGLVGLLGLGIAALWRQRRRIEPLTQFVRWGLALAVLLAVGYSLHVRPLTPEYIWLNGEPLHVYSEELMAMPARYVSPLFFWLAAFGIVLAVWKARLSAERTLFLCFVLSFAAVFFSRHTTGWIYPVALRRLVPEVLPGLALLGAFALQRLWQQLRWRWAVPALAGLVMVWMLTVSAPYWFQQEAKGTWRFLNEMEQRLPADAVVLFEPQESNSVVGWFASPLWSLHGRQALLLNSGAKDAQALQEALCFWQRQGKDVFVVAQREPSTWWPGDFRGQLVDKLLWDSILIGQSRLFPPYIWHFAFTFSIYRWDQVDCTTTMPHPDSAG